MMNLILFYGENSKLDQLGDTLLILWNSIV